MNKLKVIFTGSGDFGVPVLETLVKDNRFDIPFIITSPDKQLGRGLKIIQSSIKTFALTNKLIIHQPQRIAELKQKIIQEKPDFLLVVAYGEIIDESILKTPDSGSINIHGSLLPKYRGASPIQEAILQGDNTTGITWILMNKKMDQGDIIAQEKTDIDMSDSYDSLSEKLSKIASDKTGDILVKYSVNPKVIKQNNNSASYCKKITKEDGFIDVYKENAIETERKIRAYSRWPGCYINWFGKRLKIIKAAVGEQKISAGEMKIIETGSMAIGTKHQTFLPLIVQLEGKKQMEINEFLRGQKQIPNAL